jgi:hypothetical protein
VIHDGCTETRSKLLHEELTELLTYLKLAGKHVGIIIDFNVATLVRGGIVRKVL